MKKLFTLLLCVTVLQAFPQCPKVPQWISTYYEYYGLKNRYLFQLPRQAPFTACRDTAFCWYNPTDSAIHWWTGNTDLSFVQHADQGLFDSSHIVQLGEPLGQSGNPSRLYQNREIPANGFTMTYWDSLNSLQGGYLRFNDTAHSSVIPAYVVQQIHQADTTHDYYNWDEYRPKNYGYTYPGYKPNGSLAKAMSWTWGMSQNSSGGLTMPDNVYGGGYNILNAVGRRDTGDASCSYRLETSFIVFGEPVFESHWPEITRFDGTMQRVNSLYMGKTTGRTLWENNLDEQEYKRVVGTNPGGRWLHFTSNSGDFGSIEMIGTHANSIEGILSFVDSNGTGTQIRGLSGQMQFIAATAGESNYMDVDGSMYFNYSGNAAVSNGTTIVGNYPGPIPSTHASAQLKVVSTTKGFLPPAMTTTQKNAISNPAEGLIVYDLTLHKLSVFTGSVWETVTSL